MAAAHRARKCKRRPLAASRSTEKLGVPSCLGSHVVPKRCAFNFTVSFGFRGRHLGKVEIVLRLSLMLQGGWTETLLIPLSHARSRQDGPLHGGHDLLSVGPLYGHRSLSQFAVELANRVVDDPRFDFVDHVAPGVCCDRTA